MTYISSVAELHIIIKYRKIIMITVVMFKKYELLINKTIFCNYILYKNLQRDLQRTNNFSRRSRGTVEVFTLN